MANQSILDECEKDIPRTSFARPKGIPFKLIMDENQPYHITFLTGIDKSLKLKLHFNAEAKRMELCRSIYKETCEKCNEKGDNGRPKNTLSKVWRFLAYVHDHEDKVTKAKNSDTFYPEDPLKIVEIRMGTDGENFSIVKDADRFGDLMIHPKTKEDVIWQIKKKVTKTEGKKSVKTSYPPPVQVEKYKLGDQFSGRVPKEVREKVENLDKDTIFSYYLVDCGLTEKDWKEWGLTPPEDIEEEDSDKNVSNDI